MNFVLAFACVTHCGLLSDIPDCAGLQRLENQTLEALAEANVWPQSLACHALHGWQVREHIRTEKDWLHCNGHGFWFTAETENMCLVGYTWTEAHVMEVMPRQWWEDHAFPHELVHAVESVLTGRRGHCRWTERGIKGALASVTGFEDRTAEICLLGE